VLRTLSFLNLRRLIRQPVRALLGVVAIAAGTALLVGVLIDRASVSQSIEGFTEQRAGGATFEVIGPGSPAGLDASVLPRIEAVDGVAAAVPVVQTVTIAETAAGDERFVVAFGLDCRVEAVLGDLGCDQAEIDALPGAFAMSNRLASALGPDGVVRTDIGRWPVQNGYPVDELDELNRGNIVVFGLEDAQQRFGHEGALTSILVVAEDGVADGPLWARLSDAAGEHNVVRRPMDAAGSQLAAMLIAMLFLLSLFGLAIGAQLVRNTVSLTLEERRRDLAVTSALGMTGRSILVGTVLEAGVLGAIGGLLGVGGGMLVARPLVEAMSNTLDEVTGLRLAVHVPPSAIVAGVVLGTVTSMLAAIGPARRAAKLDVAAELQGHARRDETTTATRGRAALVSMALAFLAAGLTWLGSRDGAIEPWQPVLAYVGFAGTTLFSFRAVQHGAPPLLAKLADSPLLRGGVGRMALANLVGEPKRTGVMVLALASAIGTGVVLGNTNGSIVHGARETSQRLQGGSLYVSTLSANNTLGVTARPSPDVLARLAEIEGVGSIRSERGFCGWHRELESFCVSEDDGRESFEIFRGTETVAEVFADGDVLIGPGLARAEGLRPGDTFELPGRTGMREVRVGAIWGHPNNTGRSVSVPTAVFEELYGEQPPLDVFVEPAPGVTLDELEARIERAALDPDLMVLDPDELADDFSTSIGGFVAPFESLQRAMLVVALVAVTSTLLLVGVQRRREHGLLVAIGMAPAGLARMVAAEAGLVGVAGVVLGSLSGVVVYVAMIWLAPVVTGLAAPIRIEPTGALVGGIVGVVVVLLAAALPSLRTARLDPAAALRYE
jgi:putative ABC transport system permease protein